MSQISPPMRILLVGSMVFAAVWFAFLRPGGGTDAVPPVPAPATPAPAADGAQSAPGKAVEAAKGAADDAGAAAAARSGEAPAEGAEATGTAPAPGTETVPGTAAKPSGSAVAAKREAGEDAAAVGLPMPVAKALAQDRVLVLFFWNPKAADDRAVRAEVRRIDRHKGKVAVHVAELDDIARYAPITRGVQVQQSPSTVVIDRKQQGTLLTGYVDRVTIDQAVTDALGV